MTQSCHREFGQCVVDADEGFVHVVIPRRSFWEEYDQTVAALRLAHQLSHNESPLEHLSGYDPEEEEYVHTFRNNSGVVPEEDKPHV